MKEWKKTSELKYRDLQEVFRPEDKFIKRSELSVIIKLINDGKWIYLTGIPASGKTRFMVEALNELDDVWYLIPNKIDFTNESIIFPEMKNEGKYVLILDDLEKYFEQGANANLLLDKALSAGLQIIATYRTSSELNSLKKRFNRPTFFDTQFRNVPVGTITIEEARELKKIYPAINLNNFNRTIGSLFYDLIEMEARYNHKISLIEREILKFIKQLYLLGINDPQTGISKADIKKVANAIIPDEMIGISWFEIFKNLDESDLIKVKSDSILPEPIYFEKFIAPEVENIFIALKAIGHLFDSHVLAYSIKIMKAPDLKSALVYLDDMKREHITPNPYTYSLLINKAEDEKSAEELYLRMENEGVEHNIYTYNTLMDKVKKYSRGLELMKEMADRNIEPNDVTYSTLMKLATDYKTGRDVLEEMKAAKVVPNDITYNTLMKLATDYKTGREVLDEMKAAKVKPNVYTYSTLMNTVPNFNTGLEVLKMMEDASPKVKPNEHTFKALLKSAKSPGQLLSWQTIFIESRVTLNNYISSTYLYKITNKNYLNSKEKVEVLCFAERYDFEFFVECIRIICPGINSSQAASEIRALGTEDEKREVVKRFIN